MFSMANEHHNHRFPKSASSAVSEHTRSTCTCRDGADAPTTPKVLPSDKSQTSPRPLAQLSEKSSYSLLMTLSDQPRMSSTDPPSLVDTSILYSPIKRRQELRDCGDADGDVSGDVKAYADVYSAAYDTGFLDLAPTFSAQRGGRHVASNHNTDDWRDKLNLDRNRCGLFPKLDHDFQRFDEQPRRLPARLVWSECSVVGAAVSWMGDRHAIALVAFCFWTFGLIMFE